MDKKYYYLLGIIAIIGIILISGCVRESPTSKIYTTSEVWSNRNSLVNRQITVEGTADYYQVACTEMACPGGCCNSCGGGLGLRINEDRVLNVRGESKEKGNYGLYNEKQVGCSGNECDIKCFPLEKGKEYSVTGILKKESWDVAPYEEFYLELKIFKLI